MTEQINAGVFRFMPADRVHFGAGCVRQLPRELDRARCQRAMIITGQSIAEQTDLLWYVEQLLGPRHGGTYTGMRQHVPASAVAEAADHARAVGADCLVSLGGGSPIDAAKAVAHRLAFGEGVQELGDPPVAGQSGPDPLPHFAIPTTLSAAEFTHFGGVTDDTTRVKGGVGEPRLMPRTVFLDPEMTRATPETLWLSTGIKALDHAVERYLSPEHQPITDVLALEAIRLLFDNLERTRDEPSHMAARLNCQIAAWMSIFGAANVRTGLSHALGHQLGARCDVPHGVTSCITLVPVMRRLAAIVPERVASLGPAAGHISSAGEASRAALEVADQVQRLIEGLGLPHTLRAAGVSAEDVTAVAAAALPEVRGRPGPWAEMTEDGLTALLREMW